MGFEPTCVFIQSVSTLREPPVGQEDQGPELEQKKGKKAALNREITDLGGSNLGRK